MSVLNNLIAAKQLISDRNGWTQNNYAIDSTGFSRLPSDSRSCKFCAVGAIGKVKNISGSAAHCTREHEFLKQAAQSNPFVSKGESLYNPSAINDYLGHEAVMHLYDLAIELASNHTDES